LSSSESEPPPEVFPPVFEGDDGEGDDGFTLGVCPGVGVALF